VIVNDPETLAAVSNAFHRYEQALMTNDLVVLDELFLDSPETLRFGSTENLYGIAAIRAFAPHVSAVRRSELRRLQS
jgi:Protein of unknown function (DUF3225)